MKSYMKKLANILLINLILMSVCFIHFSFAHDTDLYMSSGEGVEPNILIIFDNSGSMDEEVPTRSYDPAFPYDTLVVPPVVPSTDRDKVYYRNYWGAWDFFANSIADVLCWKARTALTTYGHYEGNTNSTCNKSNRVLRTGNYRNYIASGGDVWVRKLIIAKQVITEFLNTVNGVKLGAMVFNTEQGGRIHTTVKSLTDSNRAQLITDINAIDAETWTPLAETLYEAGRYFKGGSSYFNSGVSYTSPIEYACQANYVIVITDGEPTKDQDSILPNVIGDRDGDRREPIGAPHDPHYPSDGSDYLDDVARYLYDTDLRSDLSGKQNVRTYTIGFTIDNDLLNRTATQGHGKYFYSQNAQQLADAFQNIINEILAKTSSFVAPVVPVSRMERTQAGDKLYLALFKPIQNKMWDGNIKKYGIAQQYNSTYTIKPGDVIDAKGDLALDSSGEFFETSRSYWTSSTVMDGGDASKGGVGEVMMNRDFTVFDPDSDLPRKIYTYLGTNSFLNHSYNRFNTTNITPSMLGLGVDSDPLAQDARDKLVKFVYGYDAYDDNGNSITHEKRDWIIGSFLHSRPLVIHYNTTRSVIYAGSNDGMLHAFDDSTGQELWGFIPPDLLNKLHALHEDVLQIFVDGSPRAYITRDIYGSVNKAILIFGERRGGNRYYALDVTDPDVPKYLWEINPEAVGSPYAEIGPTGQTWSTPYIGKIAYQTGEKWVAFFGGGYDDNQDNDVIVSSDDNGRAVYVVDVLDGSLIKRFSNAEIPAMTYSIPSDITRVDITDDGRIDRLYVGDMGGRVWRFDIGDADPINWTGKIIFSGPSGTKIFYPPDVTMEVGNYERLFFGTGDREHPKATTAVDRLYSVKDMNPSTSLTETDLYDVTSGELQAAGTTAERKIEILGYLNSTKGWFIQLSAHSGEKCLAPSIVLSRVAYYTTFAPGAGEETDPCRVGEGAGRLYALQYQNGNAAFNLDLTNDSGGTVIDAEDRDKVIGQGIPSGVVITFVGGQAVGFIGVGGGIAPTTTDSKALETKYWRILF
jgi:type IV pilus assembly protein PilY1